jgi:hypothetical protein
VSERFPRETRFTRPLEGAHIPPGADTGDIEEEAHVLNYTTTDGQNYCELWWAGGDAGTPLLAYLVDETGSHYLPELSQPKVDGAEPFGGLQEAQERFVRLAEKFYSG